MISILLATYNGEKYIRQCIDSVLNQTFTKFELLIGFNGTTDNSKNIVKEYTDNRIKIFDYGCDKGKAKTLNKLLKECRFSWCAIQDDDDIWNRYKLEYQFNYINDYDVIGTFIEYIDDNGGLIGQPVLYSDHETIKRLCMHGNNQIANTSSIFKTKDAVEINGWNEEIDGVEDYNFWLKLLTQNKIFFNIPQFLVKHRLHKNSNFNYKRI